MPSPGNPCGQTVGDKALQGEIEVLVFEQFSTSKLRVSCVDPSENIVYLTGPTATPSANATEAGFIEGNRYVVENVASALSAPGQWYVDRRTTKANPNWTLTYLANPGENPNWDEVVVPQATQLLVASGISYVTFRGLTFEHDNYTLPMTGHVSTELEPDIAAAVSFQNSNHVTFDQDTVREISGTGLGLIECITPADTASAPAPECVATAASPDVSHNAVTNSAIYDLGVMAIRIGEPYVSTNEDSNVPYDTVVENNIVEGYGRVIPASFGIGQGYGHDNLYTHNDVYDGYHCAISLTDNTGSGGKPNGVGEAYNTISFNHVYNLLQGIMNDGGSIRVASGNLQYAAPGNRVVNNRIHDVTDASIMDSNGYGGHGVYLDTQTGLVDVENNLIYRVSDSTVYAPGGPSQKPGNPDEANVVKNNILAYGRIGMVEQANPYTNENPVPTQPSQVVLAFKVTNNIMYFDRNLSLDIAVAGGSGECPVQFADGMRVHTVCVWAISAVRQQPLLADGWDVRELCGRVQRADNSEARTERTVRGQPDYRQQVLHLLRLLGLAGYGGRGQAQRGAESILCAAGVSVGRLLAVGRLVGDRFCSVRCEPGWAVLDLAADGPAGGSGDLCDGILQPGDRLLASSTQRKDSA